MKTQKHKKTIGTMGNPEWSCKDIGKPDIMSVYGVMEKVFSNYMMIGQEAARKLLGDFEDVDTIAMSEEGADPGCSEVYIVGLWYNEENTRKILDASGISYELYFASEEYIFIKDYYNMSNKSVETNLKIYYTEEEKHQKNIKEVFDK